MVCVLCGVVLFFSVVAIRVKLIEIVAPLPSTTLSTLSSYHLPSALCPQPSTLHRLPLAPLLLLPPPVSQVFNTRSRTPSGNGGGSQGATCRIIHTLLHPAAAAATATAAAGTGTGGKASVSAARLPLTVFSVKGYVISSGGGVVAIHNTSDVYFTTPGLVAEWAVPAIDEDEDEEGGGANADAAAATATATATATAVEGDDGSGGKRGGCGRR